MTHKGDVARFYREVVLRWQDQDTCLLWPYACKGKYPTIDNKRVNRLVCEFFHGPPPTPLHQAAHSCRAARCVNGFHLRWATPRENHADEQQFRSARTAKGWSQKRRKLWSKRMKERHAEGRYRR